MLHVERQEACSPAINYTWGFGDWLSGEEAQVRRAVAVKEFYTAKIDQAVQFKYGRSWSRWSKDCHLLQAYERKYLVLQICFHMLEVLDAQIMYQAGNKQDITLGNFK